MSDYFSRYKVKTRRFLRGTLFMINSTPPREEAQGGRDIWRGNEDENERNERK
jgi:hypothetical protein